VSNLSNLRYDISKRIAPDGVRENQVDNVIQTRRMHDSRDIFGLAFKKSVQTHNLRGKIVANDSADFHGRTSVECRTDNLTEKFKTLFARPVRVCPWFQRQNQGKTWDSECHMHNLDRNENARIPEQNDESVIATNNLEHWLKDSVPNLHKASIRVTRERAIIALATFMLVPGD
jgi:hypothetical protein